MPPELGNTQGIEARLTDIALALRLALEPKYRIGDILQSTVATNPGDPVADGGLGYGTWEAFGAGRVLVGLASSGTFSTPSATGGAETHALTTAELASHAHNLQPSGVTWGAGSGIALSNDAADTTTSNFGSTAKKYKFLKNIASSTAGSGTAHNNLQPYEVVYMWKRTA